MQNLVKTLKDREENLEREIGQKDSQIFELQN